MSRLPDWATIVRFAILSACLGGVSTAALACIRTYAEDEAERAKQREAQKEWDAQQPALNYVKQLESEKGPPPAAEAVEQLRLEAESGDYRAKSDYAVVLIRGGKVLPAIEILTAIEAQKPGEYVIASNLGTAYELAGDDAQALEWITTGLRRNPDSHDQSEWLHVKILEAKLALAEDPAWLKDHSVLGLDFGTADRPSRPTSIVTDLEGHAKSPAEVRAALEYQLRERLSLVEPPDAIVANLLFDLGNLLMIEKSPDIAYRVYQMADRYAEDTPLIHQRLMVSRGIGGLSEERIGQIILACVVGLAIFAVVRSCWRQNRGTAKHAPA